MSFETAIQTTIYTALKADAPLSAVVVDVYDDVPQPTDTGDSSDFPYVTIGETVHSDWDTVTSVGDDATLTIHTWSRFAGRSEVKEIQGLIYDVLHLANLTLVGYNSVGLMWESSQSFLDADGKTRHGVQVFRFIISDL